MSNRYTLKVCPKGRYRDVYCVIEISGDNSLDDLCSVILNAFHFDDDHLYEFHMDNRMHDPESSYRPKDIAIYDDMTTEIDIDSLFLIKGDQFIFHYDFGDDWIFCITVQNIENKPNSASKIIKKKGSIKQYS